MNRIILFLSFLILPINLWAADACTNPKEYTIDKRCYVTDAQKKIKPYNAVVSVDFKCTGTIVKYNNKLYLYTAKHCVSNSENIARDSLILKLQTGQMVDVSKNNVGDFYQKTTENNGDKTTVYKNTGGDWAIYSVPADMKDIPFVEISDKTDWGVGPFTADYAARVIGYGMLKIMSDTEIKTFKEKYTDFLKEIRKKTKGTEKAYSFNNGGVLIDLDNGYISTYLFFHDTGDTFKDWGSLKVSKCKYSSNVKMTDCQSWRGDSGGGIFDKDGNIMGILTQGRAIVGGENHASAQDSWFKFETDNIILLDGLIKSSEVKPK